MLLLKDQKSILMKLFKTLYQEYGESFITIVLTPQVDGQMKYCSISCSSAFYKNTYKDHMQKVETFLKSSFCVESNGTAVIRMDISATNRPTLYPCLKLQNKDSQHQI